MPKEIASEINSILENRNKCAELLQRKKQELIRFNESLMKAVSEDKVQSLQPEMDALMLQLDHAITRFSRKTINIAVTGRAGQGKSCFLQSAGNLDPNIIPENERADLTDIVSVVQNCPDMKLGEVSATIIFRTKEMLLDMVKQYLNRIDPEYLTEKTLTFEEIPTIDCHALNRKLIGEQPKDSVKMEAMERLSAVVDHFYDTYEEAYGVKESIASLCGKSPVTLTDPNIIKIFISQNGGSVFLKKEYSEYLCLSPIPESVSRQLEKEWERYYLYPAVSKVYINCRIPDNYGKLVLMDTKGISDARIYMEETVLNIISSECDAAIVVTCPDSNLQKEDIELYHLLEKQFEGQFEKQNPEKWLSGKQLFYLINHYKGKNDQAVKSFSQELEKKHLETAFSRIVDCSDSKAVREQFLEPALEILMNNLREKDVVVQKELEQEMDRVAGRMKQMLDDSRKKRWIFVPAVIAVFVVGVAVGSRFLGNDSQISSSTPSVSAADSSALTADRETDESDTAADQTESLGREKPENLPVMMATDTSKAETINDISTDIYVWGNNQIKRETIGTITFLDNMDNIPSGAWDISGSGNGGVKAWVVENGELDDMYIAGDGGVQAPEDCMRLFAFFTNLSELNFNDCFYVDDVGNMYCMFYGCSSLTELNVTKFDTSAVENMYCMFCSCSNLEKLDVTGFKTSNVKDMSYMFYGCSSLAELNVTKFDTSSVENMYGMFYNCSNLEKLDVTGFKTSNVTNMSYMFCNCSSLAENPGTQNFNFTKVETMDYFASGTQWENSVITESYLDGTAGTYSGMGPESLFDNNEVTKWRIEDFSEAYVIFQISPAARIRGYCIKNETSLFPERNPKTFTLYGWNSDGEPSYDSKDWVQISHVSDLKMESEEYTEYFENSSSNDVYKYYMLVIEQIQSGTTMEISEFRVVY